MARRRRSLHKRYRRNPDSAPSSSSSLTGMAMGELWGWVGPGFAAFAAARFVTYLATQQLAKRRPDWGAKGGAAAAVGTFLAAWMVAHRVKWLRDHVEPIVVGSAIAGVQSLLQLFVPKLGWMVGDPTAGITALPAVDPAASALPPGFTPVDDPTLYDYNDAHDSGVYGTSPAPGNPTVASQQAPQGAQPSDDDALFSDLNLDNANQMGGIFS